LPLTNGTYTNAGIQAIINDGLISLSGTATSNSYITLLSNANIDIQNNITVVRNCSDTTLEDPELLVTINGTEYDIQNQSAHRDYRTLNAGTITRVRLRTVSGKNMDGLAIRPMIYEGDYSTDIQYEPYTDGPAPNPSYPYPVNNVTGENSLVLQNENLYDKNASVSEELNGSDGTTSSSSTYSTSDYIRVIPGQDYYLTGKNDGYSNCFYDNNKNFIQTIRKTTGVITVPNNQNIAFIRFNSNKTFKNTIMFVKGSTAPTTYVEHEEQNYQLSLGNIELNSSPDGTIRDQIIGKPNEWYKREYIGKVVLNGSESGWLLAGTDTNTFRFVNNSVIANALTKGNSSNYLMCNEFQKYNGNAGISAIDSEGIAIRDTRNGFTIRILKTRVSDLSTFLAWLSEHNAIVYYVLENYTDIPITDTTLINQLNDIYNNAHSYNGVTNITTTYEDGNEQMYLDIEALKNVWEVTE
jgi:hypothetical protein